MRTPIYLDYCATTPMHADVRAAMVRALESDFGNPSSLHWAGRVAAELIEQSRAAVAGALGCQPDEIYFTSGATEADNLAVLGVLRQYPPARAHLIISAIEHHAILHAAEQLVREGYALTVLPVDSQGLVDPDAVQDALRPNTVLISIMAVNNEVGAIQPLEAIGRIAHEQSILFHTDAVQGLACLDLDLAQLPVDLLSLSAHKAYGPKGIGALYVRQGVTLAPLAYGGPQERRLRPGTENVPGIVGLGAAVRHVSRRRDETRSHLRALRRQLIAGLHARVPGLVVNGPTTACAPHVISASFPGASAEMMLIRLSQAGIAVSMGSACTSTDIKPSHVLLAMGLPLDQIDGTLRLSLGEPTTPAEVETFLTVVAEVAAASIMA